MSESIRKRLGGIYGGNVSEVSSPRLLFERQRDNLDTMGFGDIIERHPEFLPTDRDVAVKDGKIEEDLICPMLGTVIDSTPEEVHPRKSFRERVCLVILTGAYELDPAHSSIFKNLYRKQYRGRRLGMVLLG